MGFCSCGNWVDEGDICSHCGGSITKRKTADENKEKTSCNDYNYYCRQAKTSSIKEEHQTAIKFYNEALRCTWVNPQKCHALSSIAEEYEAIGDYDSAEKYWNKCRAVEESWGPSSNPKYIAGRGDFLYRRGRFKQAIDIYENAFERLNAVKDNSFGLDDLKVWARITHFIIDSYARLGDDNHKENYLNELKNAVNKFILKERHLDDEKSAYYLSETAWNLYEDDGMNDEALIIIDAAIELHPNTPAEYYNIKAIMLDGMGQYKEAIKYYNRALYRDKSNETFLNNLAGCKAAYIKQKIENNIFYQRVSTHDLKLINNALKTLPESYDKQPYLSLKVKILYELDDPVKAKILSARIVNNYDEADKAEKQLEKLKSSETYINITGVQYYQNFEPFKEGTTVDLIKEPDNPHDMNAIRVEIKGKTVGYVANNEYTLIKEVKSATDIKDTASTQAEVQFILFGEWVIAKLI